MHVRILKNPEWSMDRWQETLPKILPDLYDLVTRLGGTISGEHGIGNKRKKYVSRFLSAPVLDMHRAIKRALDPNNILNPGKIFDV